ncbi:uncharacterized protein QC763_512280 [Podospora pseudopauciseta]|uniref:Uncharacterized protein n=1 Tax=Podospora pseudopauciseta TaxID=2093780 RepID=A0ABR0H9Q7_9PEZI|nr:hypothetical protein QC763_512280 [Podospora pseudopauciseta]
MIVVYLRSQRSLRQRAAVAVQLPPAPHWARLEKGSQIPKAMECLEIHPSKKNQKRLSLIHSLILPSADERFFPTCVLSLSCQAVTRSASSQTTHDSIVFMPPFSRTTPTDGHYIRNLPLMNCCGYFDSDGDWHFIADLTAGKDLVTSRGWTAPDDELVRSRHEKPSSLIWGLKKSRSVISRELGGEVAANILSPISPSPKMVFICEKDEGAVLTIQNPVLRHRVCDESATLKWVKENRVKILRRHRKIVEQHGIWVVSKTYTTTRSGVVVMFSNSSTVEIGIGAAVPGMVTLTPLSSWTSGKGDLATEVYDDSNGVVVFMSGVYFSKSD